MTSEHIVDRSAVFGDVDVQGAGLLISRADVTCIFGSARVDLWAARIGSEVKAGCFVLFASLELRVPATWRVVMDVSPLFGGAEEQGMPPSLVGGAPTLHISGTTIFGSVELEWF